MEAATWTRMTTTTTTSSSYTHQWKIMYRRAWRFKKSRMCNSSFPEQERWYRLRRRSVLPDFLYAFWHREATDAFASCSVTSACLGVKIYYLLCFQNVPFFSTTPHTTSTSPTSSLSPNNLNHHPPNTKTKAGCRSFPFVSARSFCFVFVFTFSTFSVKEHNPSLWIWITLLFPRLPKKPREKKLHNSISFT